MNLVLVKLPFHQSCISLQNDTFVFYMYGKLKSNAVLSIVVFFYLETSKATK